MLSKNDYSIGDEQTKEVDENLITLQNSQAEKKLCEFADQLTIF